MLSSVGKPGRQTKVVTGSVVTSRAGHSFHSFQDTRAGDGFFLSH